MGSLIGCGPSVSVRTAWDPKAQLPEYKTFAMLQPNRPVHSENTDVDPFTLQRLRQLVYLGLRAKGLRPVARSEAQLLVSVFAGRDQRTVVYQGGPYAYDYLYGPSLMSYSTYVAQVDEGVVAIDLIDQKRKSVVWRGTGVDSLASSQFTEEDLEQIVTAILTEFPPGSTE